MCQKKITTPVQQDNNIDGSKDISESEIVDDIDDEEYDDDDSDDDSDDDDADTEVITKDSLIAQELDVIKGMSDRIMEREYF